MRKGARRKSACSYGRHRSDLIDISYDDVDMLPLHAAELLESLRKVCEADLRQLHAKPRPSAATQAWCGSMIGRGWQATTHAWVRMSSPSLRDARMRRAGRWRCLPAQRVCPERVGSARHSVGATRSRVTVRVARAWT